MKSTFTSVVLLIMSFSASFSQVISKKADLSTDERAKVLEDIDQFSVLTIKPQTLKKTLREKKYGVEAELSIIEGVKWRAVFNENEIRTEEFKSKYIDSKGVEHEVPRGECNTYRGYIDNDEKSYFALSITENTVKGLIVDRKRGIFFIEPLSSFTKNTQDDRHIVYDLADAKPGKGFCAVNDLTPIIKNEKINGGRIASPTNTTYSYSACRVLEVAIDADGEYYTNHGSNVNQALNDMNATINTVDAVYSTNLNTRVYVVFQNIYTDSNTDPYTSNDIFGNGVITEFQNYWNNNRTNIIRDIGFFFTGKQLVDQFGNELFGAVPALGALCGDVFNNRRNSYAFTTDRTFNYYTASHEIGHLMGATHPNQNGGDCVPTRSVMCQGPNLSNTFFAQSSINEINNHLAFNDFCLRSFDSWVMNGPDYLCGNATYSVSGTNGILLPATYLWSSSSNIGRNQWSGQSINVTDLGAGEGWLEVSFNVGCNISIRRTIWVLGCQFRYSVGSNPATDHIDISFEKPENFQSMPDEIRLISEKSLSPVRLIKLKESYRKGALTEGKITLDTKDLPRGRYYLHFQTGYGKNRTVESVRIILE